MKAIVCPRYGPPEVLKLREVPIPVPKNNEILIKIKASTVTAGDCELRRFDLPWWIWLPVRIYFGLFKPRIRILGQELSGLVESVGEEVTLFSPGDAVTVAAGMNMGGYAEFKCIPEHKTLALKPENMNFAEAATLITGGLNSIFFIKKAKIQPGMTLLVIGAGGSIGSYGVQIGLSKGAEVTVIDRGSKLEMLRSLGAKRGIDYEKENFLDSGEKYDVIFDVIGKYPLRKSLKLLKEGGTYLLANPGVRKMLLGAWMNRFSKKKVIFSMADEKPEDLRELVKMAEEGKIRAVIDRAYPLEEVADAHRYVETGEKTGNVAILINEE